MEGDRSIGTRRRDAVAGEVGPSHEAAGPSGCMAGDAEADGLPPAIEPSDRYARNLAETSGAMFLYASMAGVFREAEALAYKKYRDRLLVDCGGPSDPIEIMLIEQLALAHLNSGRLHFRAANAEGLEGARVYGGLAVLLQGELRRTALALAAYRSAARPKLVVEDPAGGVGDGAGGLAPGSQRKARRRRTG